MSYLKLCRLSCIILLLIAGLSFSMFDIKAYAEGVKSIETNSNNIKKP